MKNEFIYYLKYNTSAKNSASKYAGAIDAICKEFLSEDLFAINDSDYILKIKNQLKENVEFNIKDVRGHRMYSSALSNYLDFLEKYNNEILEKNAEDNEPQYQNKIEMYNRITYDINTLYKPKPKRISGDIKRRSTYRRDPYIARIAIELSDYKCEINTKHKVFTSKITNKNFVEAHHLIPVSYQEKFQNSLDVPSNIISLCPNCHRLLHSATFSEKEIYLKRLFTERVNLLNKQGINLALDELLEMYKH